MKYSTFVCLFFLKCLPFFLLADDEIIVSERIQSHLLVEDPLSAMEEARNFLQNNSSSKRVWKAYIRSLAAYKQDQLALKALDQFNATFPEEKTNDLLEEIGWSILKKGADSTQYSLRLASIIGSYVTKDAKALPLIIQGLNDPHCLIRSIAVQLSCDFLDLPLKKKILELFEKEKIWLVRIELIKAIGKMRLKEKAEDLTNILDDERSTYEEKQAAIGSVIQIYESFSIEDLKNLTENSRAGLRSLACDIAIHFQMKEAKDIILPLIFDTRADVKISAIKALGYLFFHDLTKEQIIHYITPALDDPDPKVSITAAWVAMLIDPSFGIKKLKPWIFENKSRYQLYGAAALAASGEKASPYMLEILNTSKNLFVKANLAIGLIGLNKSVKLCCDTLHHFLKTEKGYWMISEQGDVPFRVLEPSKIRHVDQIPNYPQAVDQMTRLSVLSILAIMEDPRAKEAIEAFLLEKKWGITGFAAATLLKEGDEDCLKIIRELLNDPNPKIRLQASLVLALYGKEESAIPHLERSYDDVDHMMKLYILEALGHIGNERVLVFLRKVLTEPFLMRRVVAASALLQSLYQ